MNASLISVRYAKALFELALEKGVVAEVYTDVQSIVVQFKEVATLQAVLDSPIIKQTQKRELLERGFAKSVHPLTMKFLLLLVENQREALMKYILIDFEDLYKVHQGIKKVQMITAVAMSATFIKEIEAFISKELNSKVEFYAEVNPNLLVGFIIIVDGKMLDTSISNKLRLLKKSLLA